ncbi:MAG: electron transfer flavoprotein subunit beta/FixA family protein [Mycobacteriales bacterium]|nr:MAG: electron transfer flavoprotein subunit beta [Pseudonocardiales bacterium]
MNIVVLVKQVPDTWSERTLRSDDNTVDRAAADAVVNEMDEHGVEAALALKEAHGGEVTVVSMGPERTAETIRKALAMGVDKAVHICDDALHGSCAVSTSAALAAAIGTLAYDVVICGTEASDARVGAMGGMLSERLGVPALTSARSIVADGSTVRIERQTDDGYEVVEATTPLVISVIEKINEPRYPSFKGIMAAKKKQLSTLSLADLGIEADSVGLAGATSEVIEFSTAPPRGKGEVVPDDGTGGARIAGFLAAAKII